MHTLYPAIKPFATHELPVEKPHVLYIEETGMADGIPVIVLHPGPGAGADCHLRRFFDPQRYRIIILDQRGCRRSTPHAEIKNNRTQDLLNDIEAIRDFLGLESFILFGGGWGSLLALLYAQLYPQQVRALLLHQIFLGRLQDINWFYQHGASQIYPDYWHEFTEHIPELHMIDIPKYYNLCLQGDNELGKVSAAKNWALWQARCCSLQPHINLIDLHSDLHFALGLATIESHYLINRYFIEENQVLANINKIRHIPAYLIHGRYDIVTPLGGAWDLNQALPSSNLSIIRDAGHSEREAGMIDAIVQASIEVLRQDLDAC